MSASSACVLLRVATQGLGAHLHLLQRRAKQWRPCVSRCATGRGPHRVTPTPMATAGASRGFLQALVAALRNRLPGKGKTDR